MLREFVMQLVRDLDLGAFAPWVLALVSFVNVLAILTLAWAGSYVLRRVISLFHQRLIEKAEGPEERRRLETLQRVFRYIATVVISVVTIMLVLAEVGISIAPILATAGVVGLAVGFGAQSLVKDYFTGFVMLIENQIRVGDIVEISGKSGLVEELTLRYVRLRDYEGAVHFVPNGTIATVTNRSRLFAYAVMDIGVAYKEDVDRVYSVMRRCAASLRDDPLLGPKILDELEIAGVDQWADSAVVIRCRIKTVALEQAGVRREFLRRLKRSFDEEMIEIPFPHRTVYTVPAALPAQHPETKG
ncbi:MAG: mechanosensitive ion channel family protein [Betaproteobacteria bacterium]|nr:mechanosensitive ion channel family protein [Betaproteobacteria bacterium]